MKQKNQHKIERPGIIDKVNIKDIYQRYQSHD